MGIIEQHDGLRHACTRCGGSCQGVQVRLASDDERQRVQEQAVTLGVIDPIVDSGLRQDGGRCVFQGDDDLCRIHSRWGLFAKPLVCRQYPLVATRVGDDTRVGVDPGCFTHATTWQTGPETAVASLIVRPSALPSAIEPLEMQVLAALAANPSPAAVLSVLIGSTTPWPAAFWSRWIRALQAVALHELLRDTATSPALRDSLLPMADALAALTEPPSEPNISDASAAFAVDATERMVWLRLCSALPNPIAVAVLTLAGTVTAACVHPGDDARFGQAVAGWCRALRAPAVLGRLLPTPDALQTLVQG